MVDDDLDASPELIVQAAAIQWQEAMLEALSRLRAQVRRLAGALVVLSLVLAAALWFAITATQDASGARTKAHNDTQQQIADLACSVVNQIPPDHGAADATRKKYACGPYKPPKAVVQPKPGVVVVP